MSSFSQPCLPPASRLPMCSSSTCIGAASRRSSLMRIVSKTVIGGVPTRRMVRRFGKSFPNGCGICAKNSESLGNRPRCVSPSLPPLKLNLCHPRTSLQLDHLIAPPQWARAARGGSLGGQDFLPQPDGTLRCRQGATLYPQERRREHDGTVRVLYAARIADCRCCPLRTHCQGHGTSTKKPRRVSAVLHPLPKRAPEEQPPGHRASPTRFATSLHAFSSLARRASALAHDVATTARTQCATPYCPTRRDYHLWALTRVCPDARFASRGAADCALLTKLIFDLD